MKQSLYFLLLLFALILLAGCGKDSPGCPIPAGTPNFLSVPPMLLPTATPGPPPTPLVIQIGGKPITVDKVVEGPLCNDTWSGTVYVSCNVQVYAWELSPDFLSKCDLKIEPGTVVYVAYHHDAPYYNGCSCHTMTATSP
jgi:hypothetical protein